jgi:uncharacterized alkaline shock family protein YloU
MSGYFENELGAVHISDEIVRRAVVPEINAAPNLDFASGGRALSRDVFLEFRDGKAVITLSIAVAMESVIFKEASQLQGHIKRAVELATGLDVATVNIRVERVFLPGENVGNAQSAPRNTVGAVGGP